MRRGAAHVLLALRQARCPSYHLVAAFGNEAGEWSSPSYSTSSLLCTTPAAIPHNPFQHYTRRTLPSQFSWDKQKRGFAESPPRINSSELQTTIELLNQANVLRLREELIDESDVNLHIPLVNLQDLIVQHGLADDRTQAQDVAEALHKCGVVLIHHGLVYLRPKEIAEMVMQLLPGGREETQARLEAVEAELKVLQGTHDALERSAHRQTLTLLGAGAGVLIIQIVAFVYLTWWELSWDVMEPIAYIISLMYTLTAYLYFLFTRGVFDLKPMHDSVASRIKRNKLQENHFDEQRYQYLLRLRKRYQRHLAHHKFEPFAPARSSAAVHAE